MASYRYRAATAAGTIRSGILQGASQGEAISQIRRLGLTPLEATQTDRTSRAAAPGLAGSPQALVNALGELGVLLQAGLTLDRALAVCVDNILDTRVRETFAGLHGRVKEGAPLSLAMSEAGRAFPPMAQAMCAAGEADGKLGAALSRLAETLDRAVALRQTVISSLIYPALLVTVATGVILTMLLVVVPQFEGLFSGAQARLPLVTRLVMGASEGVRAWGWQMLLGLVAAGLLIRWRLRSPGARERFDKSVLTWPYVGRLVAEAQTAAFARTPSPSPATRSPTATCRPPSARSPPACARAGACPDPWPRAAYSRPW
jgi:general secretion pathway protein F